MIGCVVNGPGESKHANIGISLPGSGEAPVAPVFVDGEKKHTLRGDNIATEFVQIVAQYVQQRYPCLINIVNISAVIYGTCEVFPASVYWYLCMIFA